MSGVNTTAETLTAVEMLDIRLRADPDSGLVLTPDGATRTYRDVAVRAAQLAEALRSRGVAPGSTVGLYLGNDPAWVVATFASWWVGCAFAACGTVSPEAEARRRFELVRPCVVLAAPDAVVGGDWPLIRLSDEGEVLDSPGGIVPVVIPPAHESPGAGDTAAIFFTSGTTGEAKATVHTHERLVENARATAGAYARTASFQPRVAPGERPPALSFSPFGHLAALGRLIFRMYVGRSLLIVPRFDVGILRDLAARYPLDTLQLAPAMVHALAFADENIDLGSLRYVTSGTAPLPIATRDAFERRYGVPVLQAYGSSEGGVTARERYEDVAAGRRGPGSVGRVDDDCPVRIVDPRGRDVAPGEDGEIIGRPDPSRSSRYFGVEGDHSLPVDQHGWYHTGDVGHFDEHGILYITGRLKEMFVVGGFNVYPAEVEDAIRESSLVRDAVVVSVPDDRLGEVPIAAVVWTKRPAEDAALCDLTDRLAADIRVRIAPYKVPRRWLTLSSIPLNTNGKADRRRVAELASEDLAQGETSS